MTGSFLQTPVTAFRTIGTTYAETLGFWRNRFKIKPGEDAREQIKKRIGADSKDNIVDFILTRIGEIVNYPDSEKGWKRSAIKAGAQLLEKEKIDALISSSSPVTSHIIARELKTKYQVLWIADLRDLWSQNHNYSYSQLRNLADRRLELKTLSRADALVTVSEPWAEKLRTLHKSKPAYMISNGFDPEEVNNPPAKLTSKFTITYTGSIYSRKHDPVKLFVALRDLIEDRVIEPKDIVVTFYGTMAGWVETEIKQYGLSSIVNLCGQVPRGVALEKQRTSQLLYITKWQDPRERGAYSGKIFEYLAARRPILAADGYPDVVLDLLKETNAGIRALTLQDIKNAIQRLYQEYKLSGEIVYKGIDSKINKYSYYEMARRFSEILGNLA